MNLLISSIINLAIVLIPVLFGYWLSSLHEKRRLKQVRIDKFIDKFLEPRLKLYGEGLKFIYEVEMNQTKEKELESILERWKKWYPSNVVYLPPSINNVLFNAMSLTQVRAINLHNKEKDPESWKEFKEEIQKAKIQLMDIKDIGWLPKDLKKL